MHSEFDVELLSEADWNSLTSALEEAEQSSPAAQSRSAADQSGRALPQTEASVIVDLEDVGLLLDRRKFRRRGFYVTDFSASEWCQQQCAFSMSARLPKEVVTTPEMQAGLAVHAKLQAEVVQVVDVAVATPEDAWGLKLLGTIQGLHQLLSEGMTRELYIFGSLQGHSSKLLVRGVIDQLELNESGGLTIVEHKTRKHQSLPSQAQQRGTSIQVMLYCWLLDHLEGLLQESHAAFIAERGFSPSRQLSEEVQTHARTHLAIAVGDLCDVLEQLSYAVAALPACNKAEVHYIWQADRSPLGKQTVAYNEQELWAHLQRHLLVWEGLLPPMKVTGDDLWKCHRCLFNEHCYDPKNQAKVSCQQVN